MGSAKRCAFPKPPVINTGASPLSQSCPDLKHGATPGATGAPVALGGTTASNPNCSCTAVVPPGGIDATGAPVSMRRAPRPLVRFRKKNRREQHRVVVSVRGDWSPRSRRIICSCGNAFLANRFRAKTCPSA
eukprot:scaffold103810_cov63-Phaeocystis_antarctica.AAC.5